MRSAEVFGMIIGMHTDEYRRLADNFREGEDLPLRDLWLLKALARKADNYRLVKQVSAQIKRRLDRLEW